MTALVFEFAPELVTVSILLISAVIMGNLAFQAGLGVKRWTFLGLVMGPIAYPLLNTHKRFAWRRAVSRSAVSIKV
ncbi:hypothetical protein [Shewanella sp. UCD-KL12]|uniref:hypothetical protein n=1 Tax=Shewanella sp. UCD-KL12 TaxID=1917163 RepID=UPI000970F034|nr:hypothetical protein [Shewanella sp. UCD-KL12]